MKDELEECREDDRAATLKPNAGGKQIIHDDATDVGDARTNKEVRSITAYQPMRNIKAAGPKSKFILPDACADTAPDVINTYADGGLTHPAMQAFGLGGAGVFMKNRFGEHGDPNIDIVECERQFGPIDINQRRLPY